MSGVLLDTHALVWSLGYGRRLPDPVRAAIAEATARSLSAASFYEIAQKARIGRWSEMTAHFGTVRRLWSEAAGITVPVTEELASVAGWLDWAHRDPFDRLIAATALSLDVPLLSADAAFDALAPQGLRRVW